MKETYKKLAVGIIGNTLEYYNLTLYGFLTFQLTPLFFPEMSNGNSAKLLSFCTFALVFLARPFGAILLGPFGDVRGRKSALGIAILIGAIPSFTIAFLPTYETVGLVASLLLILARITQGISIGGEFGNAVAFVLENAPKGRQNYVGSLLCASGFLGGILASLVAATFTNAELPPYFWRIPFFIGGCFGLFGYFLRKSIRNEEKFEKSTKSSYAKPLKLIFEFEKTSLLRAMGVGVASSAPFYIASIYINGLYVHKIGLATSALMIINTLLLLVWALLLPLYGKIADRLEQTRVMKFSCLLIGLSGVVTVFTLREITYFSLLYTQGVITLASVSFLAPSNAYLKNLFSTTSRSSGISIGYTIGTVMMGATSPIFIELLSRHTNFPIFLYLILVSFIGYLSLIFKKYSTV